MSSGLDCILLFGMPRSGTTWIGKLFDSHPQVLYRHEPDNPRRPRLPADATPGDASRHREQLQAFVRSLPAMRDSRVAGKRPIFSKAWLSVPRYWLFRAGVEMARAGSRAHPAFPIVFHNPGSADPRRRVVWKSIQSLSRLGLLLEALDSARAIHIVRHPCGYIDSVRRGTQGGMVDSDDEDSNVYGYVGRIVGTPLGDELGFDAGFEQYLQSLTPEERIAWMWVVVNEKAARECAHSPRYLRVRYEDICADPGAGVEQMFAFAGLDMNEQTRDFIAASTGESRAGYYSVFKNPEVAAWRWREQLRGDIAQRVMAIAAHSPIGREYSDAAEDAPR